MTPKREVANQTVFDVLQLCESRHVCVWKTRVEQTAFLETITLLTRLHPEHQDS